MATKRRKAPPRVRPAKKRADAKGKRRAKKPAKKKPARKGEQLELPNRAFKRKRIKAIEEKYADFTQAGQEQRRLGKLKKEIDASIRMYMRKRGIAEYRCDDGKVLTDHETHRVRVHAPVEGKKTKRKKKGDGEAPAS